MRQSSTSSNPLGPRDSHSFKRQGQGSGSSNDGSGSESRRRSFSHFDSGAARLNMCYRCGDIGHKARDCRTPSSSANYATGSVYGGSNNLNTSYGGSSNTSVMVVLRTISAVVARVPSFLPDDNHNSLEQL